METADPNPEPAASAAETSEANPTAVENPAPIQRGRPFVPGQSGNPSGRPRGARNKATLFAEALLDGQAEAITRKLIEKALEGNGIALRLCLERLLSPRQDRSVEFDLPQIESAADALKASAAVLGACAEGSLSPAEAAVVMDLIGKHTRVLEVTELETRLTALEKGQRP